MADTSQELERLQKVRTELESRLVTIEDQQKDVEEDVRLLREKVAIRELEKKIREKGEAVAGLRNEKKELEDKLKEPGKLSVSEAVLKAKAEMENEEDMLETEKEEPSRAILRKDEQKPERDETPEEPEKKKKLRIF